MIAHFLKKISLETYLLILFPLIGLCLFFFEYGISFSSNTLILYFLLAGGTFMYTAIALYGYYFFKIIFLLVTPKKRADEIIKIVKNQAYFSVIIVIPLFLAGRLMDRLTFLRRAHILWATEIATRLDYILFGRDVLFSLSDFINQTGGNILSWILIQSYLFLDKLLPLVMLLLIIKNKTLARKFLVFFFVAQFVALPIFYAFPVIDPSTMYVFNILKVPRPPRIEAELSQYHPDVQLASFQKSTFESQYKGYRDVHSPYYGWLALATFPSLHAAWGLGIVIYAFLLWPPLDTVLIPWFLLEITGAVYVGEHYAIDICLGIAVGIASFLITEFLFRIEKKYYQGRGAFMIADIIQQDSKKAALNLRALLKTLKG